VFLNIMDRKANVVQAQAKVAQSLGKKSDEPSAPVKTPAQVLDKVGSTAGTFSNAVNVADTFEGGGRALGQALKGRVPSAMPQTLVGKTLGKFVPGANIASAVGSASNAASVFSNPASTKGQKAHAAFDAVTSFGAALPVPGVAQASGVLNIVGSFFKPS
jgi:hypothetical protein